MTPAPLRIAELPARVYRLGREPDPWDWPEWTHADPDGTFGNRFDDPAGQYRVLYASSQRESTFRECLARFRPDPVLVATAIEDDDADAPQTAPPGRIPIKWLRQRRMGVARLEGTFCDIGHSDSLAHLRLAFAARLLHYGLDDLDASDIRARAPRRLTQEISRYVFEQPGDAGEGFTGIEYASRLGDELVNWAVFEPNEPLDRDAAEVEPDDPDLLHVLAAYGLTLAEDG